MPEASLWGLVIAFGMLALGLTLKNTDIRRRLKHAEEDLARARSEAQPPEQRLNQEITDIKELYERQIKELSQTITDLKAGIPEKPKFIYHNNLLWLAEDLAPYCPSCKEIDGKEIHVKFIQGIGKKEEWKYYECPHCHYKADFSEHPDYDKW